MDRKPGVQSALIKARVESLSWFDVDGGGVGGSKVDRDTLSRKVFWSDRVRISLDNEKGIFEKRARQRPLLNNYSMAIFLNRCTLWFLSEPTITRTIIFKI